MLDINWSNEAVLLLAIAFMFGIFEKVFDLVVDIFDWLIPFQVIDEYEQAVVLRWGRYHRTVGPGFRWKWPFGMESVREDTVVRRVAYGDVQSCDSRDGIPVNLSVIVVFYVGNIKRWMLEVDDPEDAVLDISYGVVEENIGKHDWKQIKEPSFKETVFNEIKNEGINWGARVIEVKFADRSKSKAIRLWTGNSFIEED